MIKRHPDSALKPIERKALTIVRNSIVHNGIGPSVRELGAALGFSSRSAADVIDRLIELGYLKRRKDDRTLQLLRMPDDGRDRDFTVEIPLVGSAACGRLYWRMRTFRRCTRCL